MGINNAHNITHSKKVIKTKPSEIRLLNTWHFIEQMVQRDIHDFGLIAKLMSVYFKPELVARSRLVMVLLLWLRVVRRQLRQN